MKFLIFPPGNVRSFRAHVLFAPSIDDAATYARAKFGEGGALHKNNDTAIEDLEIMRDGSEIYERSRPIGESGPWSEWTAVDVPLRKRS